MVHFRHDALHGRRGYHHCSNGFRLGGVLATSQKVVLGGGVMGGSQALRDVPHALGSS